jgi:alpha-tubulin suppressor-like RCC1 family protein
MSSRRIRAVALPLLALLLAVSTLLTGCRPGTEQPPAQQPPSPSPPPANTVIETTGAGLARLEVLLSASGSNEPLRYEFKGSDGSIAGGIALPGDVPAEYTITAFDAADKATHTGKGSIPGLARNDRPLVLPLPPTGEGEGLLVSLTRERLVLDVKQSPESNEATVRLQAFDPQGNPMRLNPDDLRWGLTDPRYFNLLPRPDRYEVALVPKDFPTLIKLCEFGTQVFACLPNTHCKVVRVCIDPWTTISVGGAHTCGLTQAGVAYCWGSNTQGELGAPTTASCSSATTFSSQCSTRPLRVACPTGAPCRFTQISAGQTLTTAIDTNGDAWWWGRGAPDHHKVSATLAGSAVKFTLVAAGFGHGCAISQSRSEIWCWGANGFGEAGAPKTTLDVPDSAPVRVMVPLTFKKIVAGGEHTCAIGATGVDVVCWGRDDQKQTSGPNSTQAPATGTGPYFFQHFGGLTPIVDVAASQSSTCVVLGAGNGVKCWGEHSILNVTPFGAAERVTAGFGHVCATLNQQAKCVGTNNWGELGIGSSMLQTAPVAVKTPPALYSVLSAGDSHTCGVTPDGDAFCWGNNLSGQVGNGTASYSIKEPTKVVTP